MKLSEELRRQRKLDHLRLALRSFGRENGFQDVLLIHQSLPEGALDEVDLSVEFAGRRLLQPVIINAMTGGVAEAEAINRDLGRLARRFGLAVAVGSQRAALRNRELCRTYRSIREANPDGLVIANLGAGATPEEAEAAVAMIAADALQLHLNAPQELQMAEGDRDFRGQRSAIARVLEAVSVPVIVKECGFGLSQETAVDLYRLGVRIVDVAGKGGTNFARIEWLRRRDGRRGDPGLLDWGIPTAASLLEVAALGLPDLQIVASGGIRYGSEAAKALALGADLVGVAGEVWRRLAQGGLAAAERYLSDFLEDLRAAALLTGARTLAELHSVPRVLKGTLRLWFEQRIGQRTAGPPRLHP